MYLLQSSSGPVIKQIFVLCSHGRVAMRPRGRNTTRVGITCGRVIAEHAHRVSESAPRVAFVVSPVEIGMQKVCDFLPSLLLLELHGEAEKIARVVRILCEQSAQ